mmetsp:Transcript_53260/g.165101  ORF Transcript_53260/g.165101 Transcript_53260/m.165101 type:complete len:96 (+) Transcript_53260:101-388(+)
MLGRAIAASMQRVAGENPRSDAAAGLFTRALTVGMRHLRGKEAEMPLPPLFRAGYAPLTQAGRLPVKTVEWDACARPRPRLAYEQNWDSLPETPM